MATIDITENLLELPLRNKLFLICLAAYNIYCVQLCRTVCIDMVDFRPNLLDGIDCNVIANYSNMEACVDKGVPLI